MPKVHAPRSSPDPIRPRSGPDQRTSRSISAAPTGSFVVAVIVLVTVAFLSDSRAAAPLEQLPTIECTASATGELLEDWEGDHFWSADNGVWGVGTPTVGPAPFGGQKCAGTNLSGSYPRYTASRLVSPYFTIPDSGPSGRIWLRFWHWFRVYNSADIARVQIKVQGDPEWTDLSRAFAYNGGNWTVHRVEIGDYEGLTVQFGFLIDDDGSDTGYPSYNPTVSTGWYVDDIELVEIPEAEWSSEDFETGTGHWYADQGVWEVGYPFAGPDGAFEGSQVAGTRLDDDYPRNCNSRLVSPPLVLSATPQDGIIRLRFWHWFSVYNRGDLARVEVRTVGGSWAEASSAFGHSSGGWTQYIADLSPYAGQTVEIGFRIDDDNSDTGYPSYSPRISAGWYVDRISIEEGGGADWLVESFENGVGDWYADGGIWQVGAPTSGPSRPGRGASCAGTVLDGRYTMNCSSRLVSPPVTLEASPAGNRLWFAFWHWFSIYNSADLARVEIRAGGGDWEPISNAQVHTSGTWSRQILDISDHAGETVQFAFHVDDDGTNTGYPSYHPRISTGWYVDQVEIFDGPLDAVLPEAFEDSAWDLEPNRGDWSVEGGVWDIGVPSYGPEAYGGSTCAATRLDAAYDRYCDSRLIMPEMQLNATPLDGKLWLSFWHWYAIYNTGDVARVEIRTPGGEWSPLSQNFVYKSAHWTQCLIDVSEFAGQVVQFCWYLRDDGADTGYPAYIPRLAEGWYVDNVDVVEGELRANNVEDFEDGSLGWIASASLWQIGPPSSGPASAYSGEWCAATILDGNYTHRANSRLTSPPFVVPAMGLVRFQHWFSLYGGDTAWLELSVDGGPWTAIHSFSNSSGDWTQYIIDLSAHVGQEVRVGFRLQDDGGNTGYPSYSPTIASGWYLDDFYVPGLPEGKPDAPEFVSVDYTAGPPVLTWSDVPADAEFVVVHAGLDEDFRPDVSNRIATVTGETSFVDVDHPGWTHHYRIATIDADGHESAHLTPAITTAVEDTPSTYRTFLGQNTPNPFNPMTTIEFSLASRTHVELSVFDSRGRRLQCLVDGGRGPGRHRVVFDGERYASGVYFYQLHVGDASFTRKMVLIK